MMAVRFQVLDMEEMTIWEQHTTTLCRDPRRGFGIAISGGRDRPSGANSNGSVVISDVVLGGPAMGRLQTGDHIVMVNGVSMENVSSTFAIQTLKTCTKFANITIKRPRKIQLPTTKTSYPTSSLGPNSQNQGPPWGHQDQEELDHSRGYEGDSSSERSSGHSWTERSRRRSRAGSRRGHSRESRVDQPDGANGLALVSGFKRLPRHDVLMKPVESVLVKKKESEEFGVKLGSQIFIKHITESGLASKSKGLKEGDLVLKINGVSSQNLSLNDTRRLIERSEGTLTLLVLRDHQQFLVNIPPAVNSDSESSGLEDISDIGSEPSQAPPSHVPPPPGGKRRISDASWTESPPEESVEPGSPRESGTQETLRGSSYDIYRVPTSQKQDYGYSPDTRVIHFIKGASIGLRLAGGNDVGIFVSDVQEGSPADGQGIQEGDQILQVNEQSFQNLTREEAVQYLLGLPPGEEIELLTQRKQDIFRKMVKSSVGDSFYIRTHFELEPSPPLGLGFTRGDVFHVLDTLYPEKGRGGSWLAVRMGRDLTEQDRGIIPNQSRAEQLASLEAAQRAMGSGPFSSSASTGARAEFWKLRGLRIGAKKHMRQSREDLSALTKQGNYPPYERVVLREASFKRPVVIMGPVADVAMQKLCSEMPDQFEVAESVTRTEGPSKVVKLDTVRVIAEKDKHTLLDVTPSAVERLNYVQYYPIVVFCAPESRTGVKSLRQWLTPTSRKSSRRLYAQATKLKKYHSHLFTATIQLKGNNNGWYQELKDIIKTQQSRPIWTAEDQFDNAAEENLDLPHQDFGGSNAYLSCDSRVNSDYETDGEGGFYTDNDMEEELTEPALARSSEPVEIDEVENLRKETLPASTYPRAQARDLSAKGQWREDSMRTYEREALRKKFTRARNYESDEDDGYDWGPATDL
ncbi:tight junction protein ZO-3 isoform X1 [Antechinus flavipes]|uniref:tight junction protein ZO-3 isoform X1 n=2 Tax=Antechinus flavipes TaxID=38775 RepID=UPI002235D711|nr:tight junction protein ZO-3 isoform X1 [Antechinus flavipes]